MDWKALLIDSGVLEAALGFVALVLAYYLRRGIAKWTEAVEKNDALKVADTLVRAALQKYGAEAKTKMKAYALSGLQNAFPSMDEATADAYIEGAVLKLKQGLSDEA